MMAQQAVGLRPLPRRNRLADWADKYLFIALFGIGAALIILLKRIGVSQMLVTAAPVAVMAIYGGYVIFSPRYRLRDDRAGDGLYYMGFLFTMVSLAYSLYEFGTAEGGTRSIVTNFGIALATTIVGLTLRVVYHQMRQDPFDVERETHLKLTDAASKLSGELHEVLVQFGSLRIAVNQTLTECTTETSKVVQSAVKDASSKLKASAVALSSALSDSATDIRKHTEAMQTVFSESEKQYAATTKGLSSAIEGSATRLTEYSNMIATRSTEATNAFSDILKRVGEINVPPELLTKRVAELLEPLDKAVADTVQRVKAIEVPSHAVESKIEDALQPLHDTVGTAIASIEAESAKTKSVIALLDNVATTGNRLSSDIAALQTEAASQREMIGTAIKNLKQVFDTANEEVAVAKENLEAHKKLLKAAETDVAATVAALDGYRERLTTDVTTSAEMVSQVHESLVSLTRTVVEKVGGRRP